MDTAAPKLIYLNNAADGWPKAPRVIEAVGAALSAPPHSPGRGGPAQADPAADCRQGLAQILGVPDPVRIVLTSNATYALNLALLGLGSARTRVVVSSVGEHNSILRPLHRLKLLNGTELVLVGLRRGTLDEDEFKRALLRKPGLVVLQHASNVTGIVHDVARLFAWAKDSGALTLLDAAQTVGHIPVRPLELNADLLAMTGRKGLHGPPGTGALWVAEQLELEQVVTGGTGVQGSLTLHPPAMPLRLEAGTPNIPALAGQAAAIGWALNRDPAVLAHEQALGLSLLTGLRAIPGVAIYGASEGVRTPVVSFGIAGIPNDEVGQTLGGRYGIVCRTGLHCAPLIHAALGSAPHGTVRFSASCFTTDNEIDAAITAVREIAGSGR